MSTPLASQLLARAFGTLGDVMATLSSPRNTFAAHALAADTRSLDGTHPLYAELPERSGADEPVRLLAEDASARRATIFSRTIEARLDVPFGWLVLDDNHRTLVFDPSGRIQIRLEPIAHSASTIEDLSTAFRDNLATLEDGARSALISLGATQLVGARGLTQDDQPVERYHFFHPGNDRWFVHAHLTLPAGHALAPCDLTQLMLASLACDAELAARIAAEPEIVVYAGTEGAAAPAREEEPHRATPAPAPPVPASDECLGERRVACACDPAFHRPVLLDPASSNIAAHGCLRCGKVTCTRTAGDDGRYTGEAHWAAFVVPVPEETLAWIAQWPRVDVSYADALWPMSGDLVRKTFTFYPATTRVSDAAALARAKARAPSATTAPEIARQLRALARALPPPPESLPAALQGFRGLWSTLRLTADAPLHELIHLAQLPHAASAIGVDLLLQQPDVFDVISRALRRDDRTWQSAGYALARDARPNDPRLPALLIKLLEQLPLAPARDGSNRVVSWGRFEQLLLLIAELDLHTPEVLTTLRALQHKLIRHDMTLVDYLRRLLAKLGGGPEAPRFERRLP